MPFHVEVSSSVSRARVFNVEEATLRRTVLDPWVAGLPFEFGEHGWEPRGSRLTILEGPEVDSPELALEQSWSTALRAATDVTRPMLEAAEADAPARTAMVVNADSLEAALQQLRGDQPQQQIPWSAAVERVEKRDPEVTAIVLVVKPSGIDWLKL
jgi:hypothetical protein